MANNLMCVACGHSLPQREGAGRRRAYCGATCRSQARRRRAAVAARPADPPALAALRSALEMVQQANQLLLATVTSARDAGHTWQEIGTALGTTRQAASQRFAEDLRHDGGWGLTVRRQRSAVPER
jgi:hypothetical protein